MLSTIPITAISESKVHASLNLEVDIKPYEDYRALIKDFFFQYNLYEWAGQMTDDPKSLGLHCIYRTEKRKFLRLFPYTKKIAVAYIESEPKFAKKCMDILNLRYDGLEIKVIDPDVKYLVDKFCEQYTQRFKEKSVIF